MSDSAGPVDVPHEGTVLAVSRRSIQLLTENGVVVGRASSQTLELAVGDRVRFLVRGEDPFITERMPRTNCLARTYRESERVLAVNLDHLFIVAAVRPLFQSLFIDRVLAVAIRQGIACSILMNKQDLDFEDARQYLAVYESLGIPILFTSAKYGAGMAEFKTRLEEVSISAVALAGISGVGKSTLLNALIPGAGRKIGEVSVRTGQGRQTTSQAVGYFMKREASKDLLIIDLPGVQHFGVAHLSIEDVAAGFPEICALREKCEYGDCSHTVEPHCAVREALNDDTFSPFRYDAYCKMIEEVREAKKY